MSAPDSFQASLQARKRELVRAELADAAWRLFALQGYETTTVAAIAQAAGVSRRTFFRYFTSKEGVLEATSNKLAGELVQALAARPAHEPPLVALIGALGPVIESQLAQHEQARTIIRLIRESWGLRRAMLEQFASIESRLIQQLVPRFADDPSRQVKAAVAAHLSMVVMEAAFNIWYDQGLRGSKNLVSELFAKVVALLSEV